LWDLVEERAASHPSMKAAFRELARHGELLEGGTPVLKDRGLLLRSREDESRPELSQTRNHLRGAMTKKTRRRGTSLAALVQSSEAKPLFRMGILLRLKAVGRGS